MSGNPRKDVVLFDTLKFVKALREPGISEEQAVAICYATNDVMREALTLLSVDGKVTARRVS